MAGSQLFQKTFKQLQECIQTDVEAFTLDLYSRGLVGKGVRDDVYSSTVSSSKGATKLLCAVESKIESNEENFDQFIIALAAHPPWREVADNLKKELFFIRSPQVHAELESGARAPSRTLSTDTRAFPSLPAQQPHSLFNQHLRALSSQAPVIHIEKLVIQSPDTGPVAAKPEQAFCHMHQPEIPVVPELQPCTVEPSGTQEEEEETQSSAEKCLPPVMEEGGGDQLDVDDLLLPPQTSSLSSQSSVCSLTEEDIQSMEKMIGSLMSKCEKMTKKLRRKEKRMEVVKEETTRGRDEYESAMAAANEENKELRKQLQASQLRSQSLEEEVAAAKQNIVKSDQQKQYLLEQLTEQHKTIVECQEKCKKLEVQVKEANSAIDFYDAYQQSEAKARELEGDVERLKGTISKYTDHIELLEIEIEVLVSVEPYSSSNDAQYDSLESY